MPGDDPAGNLAGYVYPNGVATSYNYSALNRLTSMSITKAATPFASFTYTLGATGNRLSVTELSGRTVNYGYDDLYRLTSETISNEPSASGNGQINYVYVVDQITNTPESCFVECCDSSQLWKCLTILRDRKDYESGGKPPHSKKRILQRR